MYGRGYQGGGLGFGPPITPPIVKQLLIDFPVALKLHLRQEPASTTLVAAGFAAPLLAGIAACNTARKAARFTGFVTVIIACSAPISSGI